MSKREKKYCMYVFKVSWVSMSSLRHGLAVEQEGYR
jgi:hypothetical protein